MTNRGIHVHMSRNQHATLPRVTRGAAILSHHLDPP